MNLPIMYRGSAAYLLPAFLTGLLLLAPAGGWAAVVARDAVAREFTIFAGSPAISPAAADAVAREFTIFAGSPAISPAVADMVAREFSIFAGTPPFVPARDAVAREFSVHVPTPPLLVLNPEPLVYVEGDGVVAVDPGARVVDPDTLVFAEGYLRVMISGDPVPGDLLGLLENGGPGVTLENGEEVWFDGEIIGLLEGGSGGEPLFVGLNANATLAAVEALVRSVAFANPLRFPAGGARSVVFVLSDGDPGEGPAATRTIEVIPVNHPPVARPDFFGTARGVSLAVPVDRLLENDFDPDGDPLSITLSDTVSPSGALLSMGDGTLTYNPPEGFTGTDVFTYLLADPFGGEAIGRITVFVRAADDPAISILEIGINGDGAFEMVAVGLPGRVYDAFVSEDLVNWALIGAPVADATGELRFMDGEAGLHERRFYRFALGD